MNTLNTHNIMRNLRTSRTMQGIMGTPDYGSALTVYKRSIYNPSGEFWLGILLGICLGSLAVAGILGKF